jgi:signal transduction histidine kinase
MQALRPAADAKNIQLIASVDSACGEITVDLRRLQQVLWNLVHNAIKFSPEGGLVQIGAQRVDGCVALEVRDNGRGITPDFLPHVFERFRQDTRTEPSSGLGLGLSIARHIVELHGGDIRATSSGAGQGSTFVVRLPATSDGPSIDMSARSA